MRHELILSIKLQKSNKAREPEKKSRSYFLKAEIEIKVSLDKVDKL